CSGISSGMVSYPYLKLATHVVDQLIRLGRRQHDGRDASAEALTGGGAVGLTLSRRRDRIKAGGTAIQSFVASVEKRRYGACHGLRRDAVLSSQDEATRLR